MKRKAIYVAILLLVMVISGCSKKPLEDKPVLLELNNEELSTATVSRTDIYSTDIYQADVVPYIEELSFQAEGSLVELNVEIGESVKKGDVLAKLKSSTQAKIDEYNGKKFALSATYFQDTSALQNDISIAKLTGENTDEMELKLRQTDELFQLENSQVEKKINKLSKKLTKTPEIIAPFDGEIVAVTRTNIGSHVSEGTSFIAISNPDKLQVACDFIAERSIKNMCRYYAIIDGTEYDLEYQAHSEKEISKKIEEKVVNRLDIDMIGLVSKFNLMKADSSVQAGSYAVVCAVKAYRENALSLPINAIFSEGSKKYVYEIVDGARVKTPVTVGLTDSINTEIISGIREGATVYVEE
jgi:RND family efflux transporter MFP subunit